MDELINKGPISTNHAVDSQAVFLKSVYTPGVCAPQSVDEDLFTEEDRELVRRLFL